MPSLQGLKEKYQDRLFGFYEAEDRIARTFKDLREILESIEGLFEEYEAEEQEESDA